MGFTIPRGALNVYSATGHAPDTPRWNMLQARMDLNPGRFSFYHPTLAPLLTDAKCVGLLPAGKFYDGLRDRYGLNPDRFTRNHRLLGKLLKQDALTRQHCGPCQAGNNPSEDPGVLPEVLVPPTNTAVTRPDPTTPTFPSDPGVTNPGTLTPSDPTPPVATVPEPATSIQLGIGLICIAVISLRKRKRNANLHASAIC